MKHGIAQHRGAGSFERLASGRTTHHALMSATALAMSLYLGVWLLQRPTSPSAESAAPVDVAVAPSPAPASTATVIGAVVHDLRSHAAHGSRPLAANAGAPAFPTKVAPEMALRRLSGEVTTAQTPPTDRPEMAMTQEAPSAAVVDAPAPPRRPADLKTLADRGQTRFPTRMAAVPLRRSVPADQGDNRNFLEKFFDFGGSAENQRPANGQALAYAPQDGGMTSIAKSVLGHASVGSSTGAAVAAARYDSHTAVYDISAKTVYLPDGTRLEAHSGLGDRLDDPRFVHERMKGPTPPHIYDLTPREALFHGVPALRLNPVGGGGAIFGRAGLLAHTYMLGPNGDSNGCVSFRDYYAFLRAYQSGQVKRLAVVAHL